MVNHTAKLAGKVQRMNSLEFQRTALLFLAKADGLGRGKPLSIVDTKPIQKELDLTDDLRGEIVRYLEEKGLVKPIEDSGVLIKVTAYGTDQLANAYREPEKPIPSFPAVVNVLNIGGDNRGPIQQGQSHLNQSADVSASTSKEILDFLGRLREILPSLSLNNEDRQDVEAQIGTVEQQLKARKPKASIIRECWNSLKEKLKDSAVSAANGWVIAELAKLAQHIPH
jgi:hypothetical protein